MYSFPEYALEGCNLEGMDYHLKPISFNRFARAVKKVCTALQSCDLTKLETVEENHIFVKTEQKGKDIKNYFKDIDFIEAMGNYITFN